MILSIEINLETEMEMKVEDINKLIERMIDSALKPNNTWPHKEIMGYDSVYYSIKRGWNENFEIYQ